MTLRNTNWLGLIYLDLYPLSRLVVLSCSNMGYSGVDLYKYRRLVLWLTRDVSNTKLWKGRGTEQLKISQRSLKSPGLCHHHAAKAERQWMYQALHWRHTFLQDKEWTQLFQQDATPARENIDKHYVLRSHCQALCNTLESTQILQTFTSKYQARERKYSRCSIESHGPDHICVFNHICSSSFFDCTAAPVVSLHDLG